MNAASLHCESTIANVHVVTGYSLQLSSRNSRSEGTVCEGEWMSELLTINGNDKLCVTLSISAPKQFRVLAKLFSRIEPKTVYEAESLPGSDSGTDLFFMSEVTLSKDDGNQFQLAVYVSLGVAIKSVNITTGQCPIDSMYLCLYFGLVQILKSFTEVCRLSLPSIARGSKVG